MVLGAVLVLFLIACIIFAIDFFLGFAGVEYARYRIHSLAWAMIALALLLWHGGKG